MAIQLIPTIACMSCTQPFNNSSKVIKNYDRSMKSFIIKKNNNNYYNPDIKNTYYEAMYNYPSKSSNIATPKYVDQPREFYKRRDFHVNRNRKNRKNHNIHQPGRTNCTQRYYN